jgi:hypothetical protein
MPRHIHPVPPILREKHFSDVSTFEPESLLRVAPVTTRLDRRCGACGLRPRPRCTHRAAAQGGWSGTQG